MHLGKDQYIGQQGCVLPLSTCVPIAIPGIGCGWGGDDYLVGELKSYVFGTATQRSLSTFRPLKSATLHFPSR